MAKEILRVENVSISFAEQRSFFTGKKGRKDVLKNVSFSMQEGEILGLAGESGCGMTNQRIPPACKESNMS